MAELLKNKVALITGAAGGIGKGMAIEFAKAGSNIAITDILDQADDLVKEIETLGVKCKYYKSDASSFDDSAKAVEAIIEDFGTIDTLVNNAGITRDALLLRMSENDWDSVININLKSVFNLTKAVQKIMLKKRSGSIINISSVVGVHGNAGQANYAASKAGIIGFTKSVAMELGSRGIRSNAIAPGFIETEMTHVLKEEIRAQFLNATPLKRPGSIKDVANLAIFLASDMSTFITGQVIKVCGGLKI